ncbi:hypothetical protein BJ875DRAFT_218515 [Amylocarpus encephaloides]|uniref:Uncharacterized protein n=1 Tax=Amylocarpus encephaloides TaxID=45428 RepID=A0A9P8C0H3_9HELO|nr:hypothetical protein BJ875DRAFT_218515 [Amylocarpus encephaloides]
MSSAGIPLHNMWSEWVWSNEYSCYYRWRETTPGKIEYEYDQSSTQSQPQPGSSVAGESVPDFEDNIEDERYPDTYESQATSSGNMNSESGPSQSSKKESRSSGSKKSSSKHKSTPSKSSSKMSSKNDRDKISGHHSSKDSGASVREEEDIDETHYTSEAGISSYSPQEIRQNQYQPWTQHPGVRHEEESYDISSSNKGCDDQNRTRIGDYDFDNTGS